MDPNDAESYVNDSSIEMAWAIKAAEAASIHMNLLLAVEDTRQLKLNKRQEEIHTKFRELFPELKVEKITVDDLKGAEKEKWRVFCELFSDVEDYNMGTMVRLSAEGIYDEPNTIITTKIIFLAIEAARNIEGLNEKWKPKFSAEQKKASEAGDEEQHVVL